MRPVRSAVLGKKMGSKRSHFKGRYRPRNPQKYDGNLSSIIYRSGWERLFMMYCDKQPNILKWSSEEISIPYEFEGKRRSYYPDFLIEMIDSTGETVRRLIEIKPKYQKSWKQNKAKWSSAREYCDVAGLEFLVLTEDELF